MIVTILHQLRIFPIITLFYWIWYESFSIPSKIETHSSADFYIKQHHGI